MISASEARRQLEEKFIVGEQSKLATAEYKIKSAIQALTSTINITIEDVKDEKSKQLIIKKLESLGYSIKRQTGSDRNEYYDYLIISW